MPWRVTGRVGGESSESRDAPRSAPIQRCRQASSAQRKAFAQISRGLEATEQAILIKEVIEGGGKEEGRTQVPEAGAALAETRTRAPVGALLFQLEQSQPGHHDED